MCWWRPAYSRQSLPRCLRTRGCDMENWILGVIASLTMAYLLVALIRPERF
jgi:K+-transporting ATPase KdpF subunit